MPATYPEMILFDYGHTLLYEPDWNSLRGSAALMEYAVKNDGGCNVGDVSVQIEACLGPALTDIRKLGFDITGQVFHRVLYASLGIEFSLTPLEMETVFWNGASAGALMHGVDRMIDFINQNGIRSAVISNLLWSGDALSARLNRMLPHNRFEFVITSSDYLFRKPNRLLFELALRKASLAAKDVWYCGDNPLADVTGAASAGIFPVWYDNATGRDPADAFVKPKPECEHLYVREWDDVIAELKKLQK